MNSEDEPLSGLNARLRPRKSNVPSPKTSKGLRRPETKNALDRPKRTSTPSKPTPTKSEDLAHKSDVSTAPQLLCPYCDRKFASKQTVSKHVRRIHLPNTSNGCLFCGHVEVDPNQIVRHMVETHPTLYFACLDCNTRFSATSEIAEHKTNVCEKQKEKPYRSKLRQKVSSGSKKSQKAFVSSENDLQADSKVIPEGFNGIVISCELKPSHVRDEADIEDNITTNVIVPPSKNLGNNAIIEKNAVIVLDDIQWNKRMPANFSFHNTDADQILSRLGVVHRSPRTGESTKKDWFKNADDPVQKFEKCFDTSFYSKVASNVHENLSKFLDGSFNFNPDPDAIIKTRKSKYSVVINTAEGFPILLAFEQYSRNVFDGYIPRTLAPKHKWKWENERNPLNVDDIKRDTHVNKCIITLVSSLDIWTQLCMRRKYEQKFSIPPLEKKTEKQNTISKELKEILESRELPKTKQEVVKYVPKPMPSSENIDFPSSLGLRPTAPAYDLQPAVLSGEWVRPRCYVCCACGAQTRDSRALSSHISSQHPNAQVQHYEIVGELLLNADILKHLYVPPSQMCNRTRPLRGFRECTKCKKSISLEDLHQHMLDCAGDTPAVRRKVRYRPFGVRRRRTRLPDNTIRKKIRKDIRTRQSRKAHRRQRPKIRSEVGDAETIRKMLADLPAKRHRVACENQGANKNLRPRRKLDIQRTKLIIKNRSKRTQKNIDNAENDDTDKNNKSDDENKPLRPRIKRVLTHCPRGSETLKRKVALSRIKKRAKIQQEQEAAEETKKLRLADAIGVDSTSCGKQGDQSSDKTPQRVDVNEGPYGSREQSGHSQSGSGSNRDHQSPGSSGSQNGNINNSFGPDQTIPLPLKHSIARLTSETDLHERSQQNHHHFLQQQECAEGDVSQHLPTGQPPLFENEAVVTKLDKPPLCLDSKEPLDPRNKLQKPKKGLNDCIAMLKNKLVEPISTETLSHSAPCGTDDISDSTTTAVDESSAALKQSVSQETDMDSKPAEVFHRHSISDRFMSTLQTRNFDMLPFDYPPGPMGLIPQPENTADLRYNYNEGKRDTVRRRSTRGERDTRKQQELIPNTSSFGYPMNATIPSSVNTVSRRRSTSQLVSPNTITGQNSSGLYAQSDTARNHLSPTYPVEPLISAKVMDYHTQRIVAEEHLRQVETYALLQQQRIISEHLMANNYLNKKQLAVCIDKKSIPASIDNMYVNNKQPALSPGSIYASSLQAIGPANLYANNHLAVVNPGNMYLHPASISPETIYGNSRPAATSPGSVPANINAAVSPGTVVTSYKEAVGHDNINIHPIQKSVSPRNSGAHSRQNAVSPGSAHMKHGTSPGRTYANSMQTSLHPDMYAYNGPLSYKQPTGNMDVNCKQIAICPETLLGNASYTGVSSAASYSRSNQIAMSPENVHASSQQAALSPSSHGGLAVESPESTYASSRHAALGMESRHALNNHIDVSPGATYNKRNAPVINPETLYNNCKQAAISASNSSGLAVVSPGSAYASSKQATLIAEGTHVVRKHNIDVCPEGTYTKINQIPVSPESLYALSKQASICPNSGPGVVSPRSNYVSSVQTALSTATGGNASNKQSFTSPGIKYPYSRQALISPENVHANYNQSGPCSEVSGSNYISKKQAAVAADYCHTKPAGTPMDTNYINTKQAGSSEIIQYRKQQPVASPENVHDSNVYAVITAENNLLGIAKSACNESGYINKKVQAMTCKTNLPDKTKISPSSERNIISSGQTTPIEDQMDCQTHATMQSEREFYNNSQDINCRESELVIDNHPEFLSPAEATESEIMDNYGNKSHGSESSKENLPRISDNTDEESPSSGSNVDKKNIPGAPVFDQVKDFKINYYEGREFHIHGETEETVEVTPTAHEPPMKFRPKTDTTEPALDLSNSKTTKERVKVLKKVAPPPKKPGYINFDLSRNNSESIVDLSVKNISPNQTKDNAVVRTAKPRKIIIKNPPNLTPRRKSLSEVHEYQMARYLKYKEQKHIQKLPGKIGTPQEHFMAIKAATAPEISTDPPGTTQEIPLTHTDVRDALQNSTESQALPPEGTIYLKPRHRSNLMQQHSSLLELQPSAELRRSPSGINSSSSDKRSVSSESSYATTGHGNSAQIPQVEMLIAEGTSRSHNYSSNQFPVSDKAANINNLEKSSFPKVSAIPCANAAAISISTIAGPSPLETPIKTVIHGATSKFESTTPVYTLANACITMTKIEPSNVIPSTDHIVSIPCTTSVSVTPVYTSTDTAEHIHSTSVLESNTLMASTTCKSLVDTNVVIKTQSTSSISSAITESAPTPEESKENINVAIDSETAKKIAMLPKELVEILGTMPVDHRNQLLNVLPQYVSTSATMQGEDPDASASNTTSLVNREVSPTVNFDVKPALGYSPVTSSLTIRPSPHLSQETASLLAEEKPIETKSFLMHPAPVESMSPSVGINKYEIPDQIPRVHQMDVNTVIDLTQDDVTPRVEPNKVSEESKKSSKETSEPVSITTNTKKQKVNDQTASLRAVRIKAPSERKKSLSIDNTAVKKSTDVLDVKVSLEPVQNQDDSSDLDKTLAIQQAEISSTQHNTAMASNCKYPLAISPSSTEYSGDESNKHLPQQSAVPVSQIVANKESEKKYDEPLPKTDKVSSSISTKDLNNVDKNMNKSVDICPPKITKKENDSKSKDTDVNTDKKSFVSISSENLAVQHLTPKALENEEDSDDDICLASIVKQKQSQVKVVKMSECKPQPVKVETNKKKKKDKKRKKCAKAREDNHLNTISASVDAKIDQSTTVILTQLECSSAGDGGDKIVNKELDPEKIATENVTHHKETTFFKKRHEKSQGVSNTLDFIEKQNKKLSAKTIQYVQKEDTPDTMNNEIDLNVAGEMKKDTTNIIPQTDVNFATADGDTINKTMEIITGDANVIVRITKCDEKSFSTSYKTTKALRKMKENKSNTSLSDIDLDDEENLSVLAESTKKTDVVSTSMPQCFENTEHLTSGKPEIDVSNHDNKKEKKVIRFSREVGSSENICQTAEAKDSTATPLRRSRRGKSLFLESAMVEPEPTAVCQQNVEQKTPLTKKQRIFSKLLLDKENPQPSAHSTPEKENSDKLQLNDSTMDKAVDTTQISDIENVEETLVEKRKGTKRRIGSQSAKKVKKKKSLEGPEPENADSELIVMDNTEISKPSSEDISVPSEVITQDADKCTVTADLKEDSTISTSQSLDTNSSNCNELEKKRKIINLITNSSDLSQSTKPKKCKLTKGEKKAEICPDYDTTNKERDISTAEKPTPNLTPEAKTACYNLPLPSRRARSKSVFVKSSSYDPYDIDLEDMIEQNETVKIKVNKTDSMNTTKKNKLGNATNKEVKKSSEEQQNETVKIKETKTDSMNTTKKNKLGTATNKDVTKSSEEQQNETVQIKVNKTDSMNTIKKNKLGNATNKDVTKSSEEQHKDNLTTDISSENHLTCKKQKSEKPVATDSDDSSKSDIPLQQYVEEKEKKIAEIQAKMERERMLKLQNKESDRNKNTKETSASGKLQNVTAEEELRSEQFMESFGFFSERKPRKSNLLASKKISETFHITNVSDDSYFGFKERSNKKSSHADGKKSTGSENAKGHSQPSTSRRGTTKRGRKKKARHEIVPCYCELCKKEFRRSDNFLRHQMTFNHVSKVCEIVMKIKPRPLPNQPPDEPNYEIAFKQYLDRFRRLTDLLAVKKKIKPKAVAKIVVPTLDDILADVYKAIRAQQRSVRELSRDEALFLDCCELLRGPQKQTVLDTLEKALKDINTDDAMNDDGNLDSITAKKIFESEEVRNLEKDLISGLKRTAASNANLKHQRTMNTSEGSKIVQVQHLASADRTPDEKPRAHEPQSEEPSDRSSPSGADEHYEQIEGFDVPAKSRPVREKKYYEVKEKMYPDLLLEDIDMFEDKFDKIKRKCRSQAAAAKLPQPVVEQVTSFKGRKKTEKRKGKKTLKKARRPSAQVPTKGALKGFDGIKVSIPTSDINLSAIVPVQEISPKKKKKCAAKKKRDSECSGKSESDQHAKDSSPSQEKVDVYEFMDNEDAELFEFRPSTLMERFKSICNNKDTPSSSKFQPTEEISSHGSASDGDDFVYMSDDYVGSDDETENSLLSCELGNGKVGTDPKKISLQKRKDVVEKNAVMGKIFKHNAVRAEKKTVVPKEPEQPKANLDQLFDSLLEDEPNSSALNSETVSSHDDDLTPPRKETHSTTKISTSPKPNNQTSSEDIFTHPSKSRTPAPSKSDVVSGPSLSKRPNLSSSDDYPTPSKKLEATSSKKYDLPEVDYEPSTSKKYDTVLEPADYGPSTSKKYNNPKDCKKASPKNYNPASVSTEAADENAFKTYETKLKKRNDSSSSKHVDEMLDSCDDDVKLSTGKPDEGISTSYDYNADAYDHSMLDDETGVARQRARRKCTVGKQNVLAETWSSESEADGGTHRPNSAESDIARKKKGRRKESQQAGGRRGNGRQVALKKQDIESRVISGRVQSSTSSSACGGSGAALMDDPGEGPSGLCSGSSASSGGSAVSGGVAAAAAAAVIPAPAATPVAGPSGISAGVKGPSGISAGVKGRPRSLVNYWSSEGDEEQEHLQQHGWIVGDSHKKLVTMLAHAKGRKRNNDSKGYDE